MTQQSTAIIGGGISGLTTAYKMLEQNGPDSKMDLHVYEREPDCGGKIRTGFLTDPHTSERISINMGAEFLDEDSIINLAKELNVPLIRDSGGQAREEFFGTDGKPMPNFLRDYAPIARKTIAIRTAMENDPELIEMMKAVSVEFMLTELRNKSAEQFLQEVKERENPTMFTRLKHGLSNTWIAVANGFKRLIGRDHRVSQNVIDTALNSSRHEHGAFAADTTAFQYVSEFSPTEDRFQNCAGSFRVAGGTENLIVALRKHLEDRGVQFHTGHELTACKETSQGHEVTFKTAEGAKTITASRAVIALPAYAIAKVNGLESLGLNDNPVDYTKNAKFSVMLKPGVRVPDVNAWMKEGQSWLPNESGKVLTFLVHNPKKDPPDVLMKRAMEDYAQARGVTVDKLFYVDTTGKPVPQTFLYSNTKEACWSTPSPKYARANSKTFQKMDALAQRGMGFVGTFMPNEDGTVGYMACGIDAAGRLCDRMPPPVQTMQEPVIALQPELPSRSHVANLAARASNAKNSGMSV